MLQIIFIFKIDDKLIPLKIFVVYITIHMYDKIHTPSHKVEPHDGPGGWGRLPRGQGRSVPPDQRLAEIVGLDDHPHQSADGEVVERDAHDLTQEGRLRAIDAAGVEDDQEHGGKADVDEGVATSPLHPDVAMAITRRDMVDVRRKKKQKLYLMLSKDLYHYRHFAINSQQAYVHLRSSVLP